MGIRGWRARINELFVTRQQLFDALDGRDEAYEQLSKDYDLLNREYKGIIGCNDHLLARNDRFGHALIAIAFAETLEGAKEYARVALEAEAKAQVN